MFKKLQEAFRRRRHQRCREKVEKMSTQELFAIISRLSLAADNGEAGSTFWAARAELEHRGHMIGSLNG